jgi:hypothetical protein
MMGGERGISARLHCVEPRQRAIAVLRRHFGASDLGGSANARGGVLS